MLEELTQEIKKQALELYKGFKEEVEPLLCEKDRDKIEENKCSWGIVYRCWALGGSDSSCC